METQLLQTLFRHVNLPPCLPGKRDSNEQGIEFELVKRLLDASMLMDDVGDLRALEVWTRLKRTLESCKRLYYGDINKSSLFYCFRRIEIGDFLIIYVREQNAGLLVRRIILLVHL